MTKCIQASWQLRDDVKKSMSDKKLNSLSLGGGEGGKTHPFSFLIWSEHWNGIPRTRVRVPVEMHVFHISSIDSGNNSVTIHKVIIVVIEYSQSKYLIEFHYRLFMHNILM